MDTQGDGGGEGRVRPSVHFPRILLAPSNTPLLLFTLCVVSRRAGFSTGTILGTAARHFASQPRCLHARCARCSARLASRPATLPARPCARRASPARPAATLPPLAPPPPPPAPSGVQGTVRGTVRPAARTTVRAALMRMRVPRSPSRSQPTPWPMFPLLRTAWKVALASPCHV